MLPTRNSEWCLEYALKTLEMQTLPPNEILICVGKSEDRTEEIVMKFKEHSNVPVRVIYDREGIGTGYAMRRLVEETKTELIYWMASDDILCVDMLEIIVYLFEKYKLDALSIDVSYIDHKVWSSSYWNNYLSSNFYLSKRVSKSKLSVVRHNRPTIAPIVNKTANLLKVGNFDQYFVRGQDLDMLIRLKSMNINVAICPNLRLITAGVVGANKFKKLLTKPTFLKFLYKYGLKYIFFHKYHAIGFFARMVLLPSIILTILSTLLFDLLSLTLFGTIFLISFGVLVFGLYYARKKYNAYDTFSLYSIILLQICKSVAEYYQLYKFLTDTNKPHQFGYGRKDLRNEKKSLED